MNKFGTGIAVLAAAAVGYAVYFDYQRHNSPEFRKSLKKNEKLLKKQANEKLKKQNEVKLQSLKEKLVKSLSEKPFPTTAAQAEPFLMEHLGMGEQLASTPGQEEDSAIYFFKAMTMYPDPNELFGLLSKSIPASVTENINILMKASPRTSMNDVATSASSLD